MAEVESPEKLTPEQVENWRRVLLGMVGPYALTMPVELVQRFRDRMQELADGEGEEVGSVAEGDKGIMFRGGGAAE